jgi:hypothetical protein
MRRVIAYVDGFNLYHAIADLNRPHLKWLNLQALAESICGTGETLVGVHYFTAYATWRTGAVPRHQQYVAALQHVGVRCTIGHFKQKPCSCKTCRATWIRHEEKETDVAIAVQLVADAFQGNFHRAIIISADSDLGPAIRTIKRHQPSLTVDVVAPPGRHGHARDLKPLFALTPGRLGRCLLPRDARSPNGTLIFQRPKDYDPPV